MDKPTWVDVITILLAGLALFFQFLEWAKIDREKIPFKPFMARVRRFLPFVLIAVIFFWLGSQYQTRFGNQYIIPTTTTMTPTETITGAISSTSAHLSTPIAPMLSQISSPVASTPSPGFVDDFENGLDSRWIQQGAWRTSMGKLQLGSGDGSDDNQCGLLVVNNPAWEKIAVDFEIVQVGGKNTLGLVFGYVNDDTNQKYHKIDFYRYDLYEEDVVVSIKNYINDKWVVDSSSGKSFSSLSNHSFPMQVHVEINGGNLSMSLNGESVWDYQPLITGVSLAGGVGVYSCMYEMDLFTKFSVSPLH